MFTRFTMAFMACLLSACGGGGSAPAPTALAIDDVSLTFFRSFSAGTYVFRSHKELLNAWNAAHFEAYPIGIVTVEPAVPDYNYSEFTVVGISRGIGKWCYKPNISSVLQSGANLEVHYLIPTTSTLACLRDGPLISFVLVPSTQGPISFVQDLS